MNKVKVKDPNNCCRNSIRTVQSKMTRKVPSVNQIKQLLTLAEKRTGTIN